MELVIRDARTEDAAALAHIQVDSYRTAYAGILPADYLANFTYEEQAQDWRDLLADPGSNILLVAVGAGGELLGYVLGRPGREQLPPYESELAALHVRRSFRKQGVGRELVAAMAHRLEQAGCASLALTVLEQNPACAFYERLGGRLVGRLEKPLGDDDAPFIAVERIYAWQDIRTSKETMHR